MFILINDDNLHVIIRVDVRHIEAVIVVQVIVEVILALKLPGAVVTLEVEGGGGVHGEDVPLHVVIVECPVATRPTHILLLFIVFRDIMLLQVQFVGALEIAISTRMRIVISFVIIIEMLGIIIHILCHKQTFFARITLSFLVINFNMLLHCAVSFTLKGAPSANTF